KIADRPDQALWDAFQSTMTSGCWGPGPDRSTFAFRDGKVTMFDLTKAPKPAPVFSFQGSRAAAKRIACAGDGSAIATEDLDSMIRVYNTHSGREIGRFPDHFLGGSNMLAIARDGRRIAVSYSDGWLLVYDLRSQRALVDRQADPRWLSFATF